MLSPAEAQELHELIGICTENIAEKERIGYLDRIELAGYLRRARELAAIVVSDAEAAQ